MALCCHSNETRAPIANPPNSAQLGEPLSFPSYSEVRAAVWACGDGQTDTQTQTQSDTDARDKYTFCVVYDAREVFIY